MWWLLLIALLIYFSVTLEGFRGGGGKGHGGHGGHRGHGWHSAQGGYHSIGGSSGSWWPWPFFVWEDCTDDCPYFF